MVGLLFDETLRHFERVCRRPAYASTSVAQAMIGFSRRSGFEIFTHLCSQRGDGIDFTTKTRGPLVVQFGQFFLSHRSDFCDILHLLAC